MWGEGREGEAGSARGLEGRRRGYDSRGEVMGAGEGFKVAKVWKVEGWEFGTVGEVAWPARWAVHGAKEPKGSERCAAGHDGECELEESARPAPELETTKAREEFGCVRAKVDESALDEVLLVREGVPV